MKKLIAAALAFAPAIALAQGVTGGNGGQLGNISGLVSSIGSIVGLAIPIVFALALLAFFWGIIKYILAAGNEEEAKNARRYMLWGIIAMFVIASVWGLVQFIGNAFGVGQGGTVSSPGVNSITQ